MESGGYALLGTIIGGLAGLLGPFITQIANARVEYQKELRLAYKNWYRATREMNAATESLLFYLATSGWSEAAQTVVFRAFGH